MDGPIRCLKCGYILEQIPGPRCPECGQMFDLADPTSYTRKPIFVAWDYWRPGLILGASAAAVLSTLVLVTSQSVGLAVTICLPFAIGSVLGYGFSAKWVNTLVKGLLVLLLMSFFLLLGGVTGFFCVIVLLIIAFGPLLVGVFLGTRLRKKLKNSDFGQRAHLPIIALLVLHPVAVAVVEHFVVYKFMNRTVETTTIMPVSVADAWNAVMFYEQVQHSPPLLLQLGLSRPLYSYGDMTHVGDTKTCVYDHGVLVKKIIKIDPGKEISFIVVQQGIELCGSKLKGGQFRFEPIGQNQTRVTLSTEYEPILAPRFAWQPWEDASIHTLHSYVLAGMQEKAESHNR